MAKDFKTSIKLRSLVMTIYRQETYVFTSSDYWIDVYPGAQPDTYDDSTTETALFRITWDEGSGFGDEDSYLFGYATPLIVDSDENVIAECPGTGVISSTGDTTVNAGTATWARERWGDHDWSVGLGDNAEIDIIKNTTTLVETDDMYFQPNAGSSKLWMSPGPD